MKIVQLVAVNQQLNITSGLPKYIMQLNSGLKLIQNVVDIVYLDYSKNENDVFTKDLINKINSYDWCFINEVPTKKATDSFIARFIDFIADDIKIKKLYFSNCHLRSSLTANYKAVVSSKKFLDSLDKIACFQIENETMAYIGKIIGEDKLKEKFIELNVLCDFSEKYKSLWLSVANKKKSLSYFGRYAKFKNVELLLAAAPKILNAGFYVSIYGIDQTPSIMNVQDLKYHYDENGVRSKSNLVKWVGKRFLSNYRKNDSENILTVDFPRDPAKVYSFGPYKNEVGMDVMRTIAFGCDFFNIRSNAYGKSLEYAIYDMALMGCIPVLDSELGKHVHFYDEHMNVCKNTIFEDEIGIFLNNDLSNLDEVISKMDELYSNNKKYDDFRNYIFEKMKWNSDPKNCCEKLINDING